MARWCSARRLVSMALQMELVRDMVHGRATSALGAGIFYLALAAWLHRTRRETLRLLTESFLAIGVAFLTLAVPLWFDDVWTAATWAMEGAAAVLGRAAPASAGWRRPLACFCSWRRRWRTWARSTAALARVADRQRAVHGRVVHQRGGTVVQRVRRSAAGDAAEVIRTGAGEPAAGVGTGLVAVCRPA